MKYFKNIEVKIAMDGDDFIKGCQTLILTANENGKHIPILAVKAEEIIISTKEGLQKTK